MAQFVVTVNKLNQRSSVPVALPDPDTIVGTVVKGFKFEGTEAADAEVPNKALGKWYKDNSGHFYWGGGVENIIIFEQFNNVIDTSSVKFDYNNLINIPDAVKSTKGEGVTVAIIDTGCFNHGALENTIISSYDVFLKNENAHNDESLNGHGTFISGIIAARENNGGEIIGVAPLVNLITVKAVIDDEVYPENVLAAFNWILSLSSDKLPQIINISLDFDPGDLEDEFQKAFQICSQKEIVIISAGQDEKEIYNSNIFYPAREEIVLGVGAINKENLLTNPLNNQIDYVVPDSSFYSTTNFNNSYSNLSGSSISSALVSGVYALFLSFKIKNAKADDLESLVNQNLPPFDPNTFDNAIKIFKK
jgi:major intracellular serine protease